jgi:predicted chitinase
VTIKLILEECKRLDVTDSNQIAYILATVDHETNGTFIPVIEAYWVKTKMIKKRGPVKGTKRFNKWASKYFRYYPYYGRGLIQLTWKRNYKKFSDILTKIYKCAYIDLVKNPDWVLNLEFSIKIAIYGMKHGIFTGKSLDDYITKDTVDFIGARRIINGTDKATHIADLAAMYLKGKTRETNENRQEQNSPVM